MSSYFCLLFRIANGCPIKKLVSFLKMIFLLRTQFIVPLKGLYRVVGSFRSLIVVLFLGSCFPWHNIWIWLGWKHSGLFNASRSMNHSNRINGEYEKDKLVFQDEKSDFISAFHCSFFRKLHLLCKVNMSISRQFNRQIRLSYLSLGQVQQLLSLSEVGNHFSEVSTPLPILYTLS